ncbi:uncharacterized protein EV420DRAFT_1181512 [Desarmillaria tabescens]|uniref:Uncharacterized protein n=1 Tax=Armillaria tabescens TaxID=1929756 RepID=A0AA39NB13_ARMTA|nr:uncharacterized protein EV420DRAFT_1181512 [Desarmillaria tabescens]KAK0462321.1 hypothetical protein EV420DRAFT_1181512 [Desarmillaria tabescens]
MGGLPDGSPALCTNAFNCYYFPLCTRNPPDLYTNLPTLYTGEWPALCTPKAWCHIIWVGPFWIYIALLELLLVHLNAMPLTEQLSDTTAIHATDDDPTSADSDQLDMRSLFDFESLFDDFSTPFSPTMLFYHPYNDLHTLKVRIIGVLRIPGLYEYAIRLEYTPEQRLWLAN